MTATDDGDRPERARVEGAAGTDDRGADAHAASARTRRAVDVDERDDVPVHRCARCERPFADESLLALHRGLAHPAALDDAEVAAFREAHAAESAAIRRYRLFAVVGLLVCYFGLLVLYALV